MPLYIASLDPNQPFSEMCETLVVNVHGAGVRSPAVLPIATAVRLETADHRSATAWVIGFEPIGRDAKWWLLGVALEQPANFWGVPNPPENWKGLLAPAPPPVPGSPDRNFGVWPGAYGPQHGLAQPPSGIALVAAAGPAAAPQAAPREVVDSAELLSRLQSDLEQRTEEHWRRLRGELEPQLLASTRGLQQEIQDSLAAWRAERTAVEGKLQELLTVRDGVSARLDSITGLLREQSAPLREEIIAEARTRVERLLTDFREQLRGERQAAETAQHSLTNALEEQVRWDRSAEEISNLTTAAMDRLERLLQANLAQAEEKLQQNLLQELQQRQQAASRAIADHMEDLHTSETAVRERVHQLALDLSTQSEQALAQLRVQVQELCDKQEQEISERFRKRDAASETALQTVGGRILSSAREQLRADLERHQQELAASRQALGADVETLQDRAGELETRLAEVRQAREFMESLAKGLPDTIQQRIAESVAAAVEKMSGPAQDLFTARVQTEIAALERRMHEVAEQIGASFSGKLAAEAAQRDQQWQSTMTSSLAELQAQAAAIRDEAARVGKELERQREARLSEREQQLRDLIAESQKEAEAFLQRRAATAATALQQELRQEFEHRQQAVDRARAAAVQQLESLQKRAEELTALVDVEMRKHADDLVEETASDAAKRLDAASKKVCEAHLARAQADVQAMLDGKLKQGTDELVAKAVAAARAQLQSATDDLHRDQLARAEAELDSLLGAIVQQATDAGSELRQSVQALQHGLAETKTHSDATRRQVEEAQRWLARETEQFQKTVHDTFLQAASELKGRVHQALEMAEEPIGRRGRELQSQLAEVAHQKAEELRGVFEQARTRLQTSAKASEGEAQDALQEQLHQALQSFRDDAAKLAKSSMERWQAALKETLTELPRLLSEKLGVDKR
jgi:hypothetical protein